MKMRKDDNKRLFGNQEKQVHTFSGKVRKNKNEKRRAQLAKQADRQDARIAKYGSGSVVAVASDMNRRFVAAFLALVFALSCLVVGINFVSKAEEYNSEDKPVEMQVLVNDELLRTSDTEDAEAFTVMLPTALIENGMIADGIEYQKTNEDGEVLVDSIQNKVATFYNASSLEYLTASIDKANGDNHEISNLMVDEEDNVYCLYVDAETTDNSIVPDWKLVEDGDILYISFSGVKNEEPIVEEASADIVIAGLDDAVEVNADGTIPESNGVLPTVVKGLFKAPVMKAAAHLQPVDFKVLYNDTPMDDITISVPAGGVEENVNTASVKTQEEAKLHSKATFRRGLIWKWDDTSSEYIQYEVVNVGKYEDKIYYSLDGTNEDTGILLGEKDKLYLQYNLKFSVSYIFTPEEGGNIANSQTSVNYGKSLPVSVTPNTYYTLTTLTYNIVTGYAEDGETPSTYKYGNPQTVTNKTIPASDITGDVIVYATFTKETEYYIDANGIEHGHVCAQHSVEYVPDSGTNDDIAQWGDTDTSSNIKHGVTAKAGGTAYLVMFAQKSTSSTDAYFLNAIWLNDEEVKVPTTYSYSAGSADCVATTTLSNGSVVTISLVSDSNDSHLKNNSSTTRLRYIIKIENVQENININVYFRPYSKTIMYLKGLRGIANTAAAYPVDTYLRYVGVAGNNANNALYFLDENNGYKSINHMYSSYNTSRLKEQVNNDKHLDDSLYFLGHNLDHFHFHNVYLVKVKPGYNYNHIAYSDLLTNYKDGSSTLNQKKNISITTSTTNSSFQTSYDTQDYYTSFGKQYYYYCRWDTALTSSNIATGMISAGYYSVLTNEVSNDDYWDNATTEAVKTYTAFLTGAKKQHYYKGIMLPELTYYNNSMEINSFAYKYRIQYFVNGVDQNGSSVTANYTDLDASTHEFESGNKTFKEKNRHAVEIATNPSSSAVATEFNNVVAEDVIIPEEPEAIDNANYRYSFLYWKLVKCNASTGAYVSDVKDSTGKIIKFTPGETFSLSNEAVGYYTAPASTVARSSYTGEPFNISLAGYEVTSGDAEKGYAWGDYTSSDDEALTFTFMPVWNATPIGDYLNYNVLAYKDTPTGALKDGDNYITKDVNGKTYYLYYKTTDGKAAPTSEIVSLNQHYPTDGATYTMNEDLTDEKIERLVTADYASTHSGETVDDTIEYYYDVSEFAVTLNELTRPKAGDPNYSDPEKLFDIVLTLTKSDDSAAEAGTYGDVTFNTSSGITTASIQMKSGDTKTLTIPAGYKLAVAETDSSRTSTTGIYDVTYSEDGGDEMTSYVATPVNTAKTITVINTLAAPDIDSGILDKASPITIIMIVLSALFAIAAIVYTVYIMRKKEAN